MTLTVEEYNTGGKFYAKFCFILYSSDFNNSGQVAALVLAIIFGGGFAVFWLIALFVMFVENLCDYFH